jgi:cytochrome o ubiquinol oxidase subunit 2
MSAMQTQLSLEANSTGEYVGKDTEINGAGYAGMTFTAKSVSQSDFSAWIASVKDSSNTLTIDDYNSTLAPPSEYVAPIYYSSVDPALYGTILMKYMAPTPTSTVAMPTSTQTSTMPANMPGMQM